VRRVLAEAMQNDLRDPRVRLVTLTDVKLSPDGHYAVGYVTMPLNEDPEEPLKALNRAAPFLRRTLARKAGLRHTPQLRFLTDDVVERGSRLEQIFQELRSERPDEP
jgi:ribosome-binding factor A